MQRPSLLVMALAVSSCLPDVGIDDPTIQLTCTDDADCPEDFACKQVEDEGRCIAVSVLSREPIVLTTGLVVETPRVGAADGNNTLRATFTLSEVPVAAVVEVDGQALSCEVAGAAPAVHTCSLAITDAIPEGQRTVSLRARDAAANLVVDRGTVVVDRRGPALLQATIFEAFPGQPLTVAPGGTVTLSLVFDEPIAAASVDVAGEACAPLTIDGARATCSLTIAAATEGPRAASVTATDDLDNSAVTTTPELFVVDATAPPAPDVATVGAVVYERAPWGSGESDRARFTVTAQPTAIEAGAELAVFADLAGTLLLVQGAPGVLDLGAVDRARAYVAAVDAAGNRSAVVPVREQRWIASLGNKVGTRRFENPHQLFAVPELGVALQQPGDEEVQNVAGLDPGNAGSVTVTAVPRARLVDEATLPPDRQDPCLAFDRARGEVVLFGGRDGTVTLNDTWLFADGRWRQANPATSPPPRHRAGCAWDALRDRTVLVGGTSDGNAPLDEIWEWDGVTWARAGVSLDDAVSGATVAFDEARLSLVVIGGEVGGVASDLALAITADGVTALPSPLPPARAGATAVAVDGGVLVFGGDGRSDTWRLTETGFVEVAATPPTGDLSGAVAFALGDEVYLQTGTTAGTFRLDDGAWVAQPVVASLGLRIGHRAVGRDDDALIVGGASGGLESAHVFRVGNDVGRFAVINGDRLPGSGTVALAFDPVTSSVIAIDANGDVFADDGNAILDLGRAPPGVLVDGSASGSGALGRPLVVGDTGAVSFFNGFEFFASNVAAIVPAGGDTRAVRVGDDVVLVNAAETWRLRDGVWTRLSGATPRLTTGFAIGALGDRVVAIGGDVVAILNDETWTTLPMVGPAPRINTALVSDDDADRVLMFGGLEQPATPLGDLWAFDGTTFTRVELEGPGARFGHALARDRIRGELVLAAGGGLDEVWRIKLDSAVRPALRFAVSVAASQVPLAELRAIDVTATGAAGPTLVWGAGSFSLLSATPVSRALLSGDEATLQLVFPAPATGVGATATLDAVDVALTFRSN